MKTGELSLLDGFTVAVQAEDDEIKSLYCADLLSWAMGRAPAGCAWCTVMGNVNAVAVASLADVAVIVLCEGAKLDEDARARAQKEGVNIVVTEKPAFDAALAIAKTAGLLDR